MHTLSKIARSGFVQDFVAFLAVCAFVAMIAAITILMHPVQTPV